MNRRAAVLALAALGLPGTAAPAHDIPDARIDRAIQIVLRPGRLNLDYEVSLAELTLVRDYRRLFGSLPAADRLELYGDYGRRIGPLDARGFLVHIDGQPIALSIVTQELSVEEHPRYVFHLAGEIPSRGRLSLRDTNYVSSEGTSRLAVRAEGVVLLDYDGPRDVANVEEKPLWQLDDDAERRTKEVQLHYEPGPESTPAARTRPATPRPAGSSPSAGLPRLLEGRSRRSLAALLLAAGLLGAAHAVQPGHGKTLVAAATMEGGGPGRGLLLAGLVTIAHMSSVLALAAVLSLTQAARYGSVNDSASAAAGFVIAAVGAWRLGRHLNGLGEHGTDAKPGPTSSRSLLGLGLAGGLVPCWDAILLVLLAATVGRLGLGVLLLAAFSTGMGGVLLAVGLAAGRFGRWLTGRDRARVWERRLGLLSGGLLLGIGAAMLLR